MDIGDDKFLKFIEERVWCYSMADRYVCGDWSKLWGLMYLFLKKREEELRIKLFYDEREEEWYRSEYEKVKRELAIKEVK